MGRKKDMRGDVGDSTVRALEKSDLEHTEVDRATKAESADVGPCLLAEARKG
jgi:hypothetical protein